ncbi:hypothetical protein L3Y34_013045 [Caenorhabditis briggsae]|uniref:Uncharacterized protein n=1 Tax=Caenorhabditis briggsae TaxID=6238 RepID=A0AAE9CVW3_CAEBR|nr:hypothetical protein L3Y34_013045 [Caenorhabditis briggsae]
MERFEHAKDGLSVKYIADEFETKTVVIPMATYAQMNKEFDKASEITQFLKALPGIQVELPILHEFWRIKMIEFNKKRRIARQQYEKEQARKIGSGECVPFIRSLQLAVQARNKAQEAARRATEEEASVAPVTPSIAITPATTPGPQTPKNNSTPEKKAAITPKTEKRSASRRAGGMSQPKQSFASTSVLTATTSSAPQTPKAVTAKPNATVAPKTKKRSASGRAGNSPQPKRRTSSLAISTVGNPKTTPASSRKATVTPKTKRGHPKQTTANSDSVKTSATQQTPSTITATPKRKSSGRPRKSILNSTSGDGPQQTPTRIKATPKRKSSGRPKRNVLDSAFNETLAPTKKPTKAKVTPKTKKISSHETAGSSSRPKRNAVSSLKRKSTGEKTLGSAKRRRIN